jgi:Zn-dependent peptidase ImmA (M78 family)
MHEGDPVHVDLEVNFRMKSSNHSKDMREVEANAFAAALLLPEELIKKALKEIKNGIDMSSDSKEIQKLAKTFEVSQQALLIRLGKLGLVY